jgi:Rad3-related DNA helicase
LQEQYIRDFKSMKLTDIRGMNNYDCRALLPGGNLWQLSDGRSVTCDHGPCRTGIRCDLRDSGCDYFNAVALASNAEFIVTNYSYWVAQRMNVAYRNRDSSIGDFDTIILDEAHDAPDNLCSALAIEITAEDLAMLLSSDPESEEIKDWQAWASRHQTPLNARIAALEAALKVSKAVKNDVVAMLHYKQLLAKLERIAGIAGRWVVERTSKGFLLEPVWPAEYTEELLYAGASKVVLMSATIRPKTAEILGISEFDWADYPSSFPVSRRPFYTVPTVRMHYKMPDGDKRYWAQRISQIVRSRPHVKGIIHTVSYDRAKYLVENLDVGDIPVFTHTGYTTRATVEKFKRAKNGVIISPSLSTGYDFPYDLCRYQIIGKVPWPDTRGAVMQARRGIDKEYPAYITAQQIVQMAGRGTRSADDFSEVFCVDDFMLGMLAAYRHLFPASFLETVQSARIIPKEPSY